MPVPPSLIEELTTSLDELKGLIKLEECRSSNIFGTEEEDRFILLIARMVKRHEELIQSLRDEPVYHEQQVSDHGLWETVCYAATSLLGIKVSQDQLKVSNIKRTIETYKLMVRTITQIRRKNLIIYALALCGVFKPPRPELNFTLNGYFKNASMKEREVVQVRAEKLYESSRTAAFIIDFPQLITKGKLMGSAMDVTAPITNLSRNMSDTLECFLHIPNSSSLDKLVEHTTRTTESVYQYFATPAFLETRQTVSQERMNVNRMLNIWEDLISAIAEHLPDYNDDDLEPTTPRNFSNTDDDVIREVEEWNRTVTPSWLMMALPGRAPMTELLNLSVQALTYANISSKIPRALKIAIVVRGQANDESVFAEREGGFAHAYGIALDVPMIASIPTSRYNCTSAPRDVSISKIAVKVIKPVVTMPANQLYSKENATCARIIREMRIWSKLKHDNILPLLGLWDTFAVEGSRARYPVAISPWMDGGDMHEYLHDNEHIPLKDRLYMASAILTYDMRDIADALAYMHSRRDVVVHGDLKANNVLVDKGKVYLSDFGLSRMKDGVTGQSSAVHANIRWAAPELFKLRKECKATPTCETDMFSFGSVFLEVLTGDYPWPSLGDYDVQQLRNEQITRFPERPDSISKDSPYWQMMRKCWRVEPVLRPTSSQALGAIEDCIQKLC